ASAAAGGDDSEGAGADAAAHGGTAAAAARPGALVFAVPDTPTAAPAVDAYSLRLITVRRLYDHGTLLQKSPALAGLGDGGGVWANPADIERLGVADGGQVRLTSSRGATTTAIRADAGLPRGTLAMEWNRGEPSPAAFIDAALPVTDVRVETTS
ncbi:MAG: NADH-quinone oxidoreductase, chain, partial [Acidimicrobiales bacterium]|nr:NADH-quinone oxidoreductase, chain [Acidimicrobiales bacterium]